MSLKVKHRVAVEVIYELEDHITDVDDIDDDELLQLTEEFICSPKYLQEGIKTFTKSITILETYGEHSD